MKITRSSKVSLKFMTAKKRKQLEVVMEEYSKLVNIFIDMFWQNECAVKDLTKTIYSIPITWLSARMRQCAAREALSMCQSANQYKRKTAVEREVEELLEDNLVFNQKIKPHHYAKRMVLSSQIATLEKSKNSFDMWVVLSCIGEKFKISIPVKTHKHFQQFVDWRLSSSILITSSYIQFTFKKEVSSKKNSGSVVGIDVGINHLIASSDNEFFGNNVRNLIACIKRKRQGSNAYYRAKKTLKYYMNKVVKDYFTTHDLRLVVVERLYDLKQNVKASKQFRKTLSNWNYRELLDIIQKHTENNRVSFRTVNPYKTSQECPECHHTQRENRVGENFKCLKCGFSEQADYVGSLNIRNRFLTGHYGACFQT